MEVVELALALGFHSLGLSAALSAASYHRKLTMIDVTMMGDDFLVYWWCSNGLGFRDELRRWRFLISSNDNFVSMAFLVVVVSNDDVLFFETPLPFPWFGPFPLSLVPTNDDFLFSEIS